MKHDGRATLGGVTAPAGVFNFGDLYRINQWNGIALKTIGASDTVRNLDLEIAPDRIWYVKLPAALSPAVGDVPTGRWWGLGVATLTWQQPSSVLRHARSRAMARTATHVRTSTSAYREGGKLYGSETRWFPAQASKELHASSVAVRSLSVTMACWPARRCLAEFSPGSASGTQQQPRPSQLAELPDVSWVKLRLFRCCPATEMQSRVVPNFWGRRNRPVDSCERNDYHVAGGNGFARQGADRH